MTDNNTDNNNSSSGGNNNGDPPAASTTPNHGGKEMPDEATMLHPGANPTEDRFIQKAKELEYDVADLPENFATVLKRAADFAHTWQQSYIVQRQQQQQLLAVQEAASLNKNLAICCRIYVGSIVYELSKEDLIGIFEPFGCLKTVDLAMDPTTGKHKGYSFIEYDAPEAAVIAVNTMNGATVGNRPLRVGRPSSYPPGQPNNGLPFPPPERVYVANVHPDISESDIEGVFEAFGKLRRVCLVADFITRKHKGYGYLEYEVAANADAAAQQMNQFDLGGRPLTVCKAIAGLPWPKGVKDIGLPGTAMESEVPFIQQQQAAAQLMASSMASLGGGGAPRVTAAEERLDDSVSIKGDQRWKVMQKLVSREDDSHVVVLRNMVKAADVDDSLEEEVAEECGKFGTVKKVVISVQKRSEDDEDPIVKIFVLFDSTAAAQVTVDKFNGRFFAGNQIKAALYDEGRYLARDYEG